MCACARVCLCGCACVYLYLHGCTSVYLYVSVCVHMSVRVVAGTSKAVLGIAKSTFEPRAGLCLVEWLCQWAHLSSPSPPPPPSYSLCTRVHCSEGTWRPMPLAVETRAGTKSVPLIVLWVVWQGPRSRASGDKKTLRTVCAVGCGWELETPPTGSSCQTALLTDLVSVRGEMS